ncbi:hypothetical protein Lser_V15G19385 [Lactuca serriola]
MSLLSMLPFSQPLFAKENLLKASISFNKMPFTTIHLPRSMFLTERSFLRASKVEILDCDDDKKKESTKSSKIDDDDDDDDSDFEMDEDERIEFRKKIRQMIEMNPEVKDVDPEEKKKMMEKLLSDYPLVVDEEDPDWPEDAEGRGFNFSQFFDKMTIKNVKKDDEDYDSDGEVNWQDIRAIKDIKSEEWEDTVFQDLSPLIVLVHNRYRRPKENEMARDQLEKAIQIIWDCRIPSPRCVAIDAVVECDLVSTLGVSVFPELIFTKVGKILHREKEIRTADELSKMMAFFYYGAAKPPCLGNDFVMTNDAIPGFTTKK